MKRTILILAALALVGVLTVPAQATHTPTFNIVVNNLDTSVKAGEFDYTRALPSGGTWLDGDRIAYRCAYTFLRWEGALVGRITFVRAVGYAQINDGQMHEGLRRLDGTLNPAGTGQSPSSECPVSDVEYEPDATVGPLPFLQFTDGATVIETRNYANVREVGAGTEFQILSHSTGSDCNRVGSDGLVKATAFECFTIVIYQNSLPLAVAYYDRISSNIDLTSNFVDPPPPPTPVTLGAGTSVLTCEDASVPVVTQADPLLVTC